MLLECFPSLKTHAVIGALRKFFDSWAYPIVIAAGMVLANLFSLELYLFYFYLVLGAGFVLVADDLRYLMPIVPCCYMCISRANNPAADATTSAGIFYDPSFRIHLVFIICVAALVLISRLVMIMIYGERRKGVPKLAIGFAALGLSFVLGGLFSPYYSLRTALFGLVEIISLCGLYFFFYYGVNWKTVPKEYFAKVFTAIGFGIFFEILGMYYFGDVFASGDRGALWTGWGVYNNVGCAIAMCLPAPLYLAATKKHGWVYLLLSFVPACGLVLTQSRGSILFGLIVYGVALVCAIVASKKKERIWELIVVGGAALGALIAFIVLYSIPSFGEKIAKLFSGIVEGDFFDSNGRWKIYTDGIEQFKGHPAFGVGFYECGAFRWGDLPTDAFLPPRYHDTYIQLLASGGIVALCCYLYHRAETLMMIFRRFSWQKLFCGLCCAALIATAIVDCHFFNFGPGLMYGILLVCAECSDPESVRKKRAEKRE